MLRKKSFQYNKKPIFKLVSGKSSHYYVNCKPTTLNARGMFLIGNLIFNTIKDLNVSAVGGLAFGAAPIAIATAFASEVSDKNPINAFSIRKTQKDHGIIKWIEGDVKAGDKVVVIDDVVTTGGSTIKAIERARSEGLIVIKVVILVDRQEGGVENIQKYISDVSTIISRDELMQAGN